jgi:hypothetical protein
MVADNVMLRRNTTRAKVKDGLPVPFLGGIGVDVGATFDQREDDLPVI